MIARIREWPLAAQIAVAACATMLYVILWHMIASLGLRLFFAIEAGTFVALKREVARWSALDWWLYWSFYPSPKQTIAVNRLIARGLVISGLATTFAPFLIGAVLFAGASLPRAFHDNARWATWADLRRAGFRSRGGLYLGRLRGRFVRLGARARVRLHIAIIAPTQSGKGVGYVIPIGLNDADDALSHVWYDPKFEAWTKTSGWQKSTGANVVLFAPLHPEGRTARWNPFAYVRRNDDGSPTVDTWGDIEAVVHALIPKPKQDGNKDIWNNSARIALTAIAAFLSETPGADFTLPAVVRLSGQASFQQYVRDTIQKAHEAGRPYSAPVVASLAQYLNGSAEFLSSIKLTAASYLGVVSNPRVAACLSGNDFDVRRLMKERTALYVGVMPPDFEALKPILQLFFQQLFDLNMRTPPGTDPEIRFECNVVLDEYADFDIPRIDTAFKDAAGFGFRIVPIIQTPAQLRDRERIVLDNCRIKIYLGPNNVDLCKQVSAQLGTVRSVRRSRPLASLLASGRARSSTESEHERPLLSPYEISQMADDEALLMKEGMPGARLRRIRYYDMHPFSTRLLPPVVVEPIPVDLQFDDGSFFGSADAGATEPVEPRSDNDGRKAPAKRRNRARNAAQAESEPGEVATITAPAAAATAPAPVKAAAEPSARMSLDDAEAVLRAATDGDVDLDAFALSADDARRQIERIVLALPTTAKASAAATKAGATKAATVRARTPRTGGAPVKRRKLA